VAVPRAGFGAPFSCAEGLRIGQIGTLDTLSPIFVERAAGAPFVNPGECQRISIRPNLPANCV